MDILKDIELSEEQSAEFIKRLNEWKETVEANAEQRLEAIQEEIEEKSEEKYSALFEEAKEKLQEVYANRLDESLKELYNVVKERTVKDLKESEEFKVIEKVKELIAPFVVDASSYQTIEEAKKKHAEIGKELKHKAAKLKLEKLMESLPESIQATIAEMIGDVDDEDKIVEEFNKAVKIMKITKEQLETEGFGLVEKKDDEEAEEKEEEKEEDEETSETSDSDEDEDEEKEEDDGEDKPKKKKAKKDEDENESVSDDMIEKILSEGEENGSKVITEGDQSAQFKGEVSPEIARMRKLAGYKK